MKKSQNTDQQLFNFVPLEQMFPLGMFVEDYTKGSKEAYQAFKILENLIIDDAKENLLLTWYSNLQNFSRFVIDKPDSGLITEETDVIPDFLWQFAKSLSPEKYSNIISQLNVNEAEVFFKNFLFAHEYWGHTEGVVLLVKTMLENAVNHEIKVEVDILKKEKRKIPENFLSKLGKSNSRLGYNFGKESEVNKDFVIGHDFYSRPSFYDLYIGPISYNTLERLQYCGWAEDIHPGEKLLQLIALTEPYYLITKAHILLATKGFKLKESKLGMERLGSVVIRD